MLTVIQRF